jgi:hypothetical protein
VICVCGEDLVDDYYEIKRLPLPRSAGDHGRLELDIPPVCPHGKSGE